MIIDVNACLGHYPFRSLRFNTAEKMLGLMDRNGIDRALVSSLHAVFYRDAHRGNEELFEDTKSHGSRFIPVATVNPKYVGWERDLAEAVERWKMKIVTLVPNHHGYSLADEHGRAALTRIAQYGVPVMLMQRFEDRRQRHHWDRAEDLQVNELLEAAGAHPTLKFVLVNWLGLDGQRLVEAGLKGRCLIDFARTQVVYRKEVPKLIEALGVEAIAFGSHMPFDYVGPSLVKLANVRSLRTGDYEKIAWQNAAGFLEIEG
ncbi:MAG: amidohydrolase family protein [Verrucomicrobia bacterium]|nr:amidohydrolase family protein [Verrucomicrobiota bacterium]